MEGPRLARLQSHFVGPVGGEFDSKAGSTPVASVSSNASKDQGFEFPPYAQLEGLTKEQRESYANNGYFVVKGLVPAEDLQRYRDRFVAIAEGKVEPAPFMTVMRDVAIAKTKQMGEKSITKLQAFQEDEVLFSFASHPEVLKYVRGVIGNDVMACHSMLINKPPDLGQGSSRHPPHQDLWYFPFRPANAIMCAWTAMQRINTLNGCLFVLPGSHKGPLLRHEYPNDGVVNKAYHGIQNMASEAHGEKMVQLEMEAGDTVFFHPLLIHGSGRNRSDGFRKAISIHFASSHCYYEDMTGTMQEYIAKEVEEMAARRGAQVSFNDYWRFTSKLVSGQPGTMSQD